MDNEQNYTLMPDEAAMAQLAYTRWERAEAETMAEYVSRRRTVDLASLARQIVEEELTDAERTAVEMRYFEDKSPAEIAHRLGVNRSTVTRTLRKAEARIRAYLKYVVRYQHDLRHVPFLPLEVRKAMVISAARYGTSDASSTLRKLRARENLEPEAVAGIVGLSPERLCAIEDGQAVPDAHELLQLSAFYGVSADSILKGETPCNQPH